MSFHPAAPSDKSFKLVQKANDLFERHHYAEAVTEYTKVLSNSKDALDSYLALAYSNRSASYIKLRQYEKARLDAVKVMTLSPKWSKVHHTK
jgi:tetratricopeptide (TPR) repeat protein